MSKWTRSVKAEDFGIQARQVIESGRTPVMQPGPLRHPVRQSVCDRKATDPFQLSQNDDHLPIVRREHYHYYVSQA